MLRGEVIKSRIFFIRESTCGPINMLEQGPVLQSKSSTLENGSVVDFVSYSLQNGTYELAYN